MPIGHSVANIASAHILLQGRKWRWRQPSCPPRPRERATNLNGSLLWVAISPSQPKKRSSEQTRWCGNRSRLPVECSPPSRRPSSMRISMGDGQGSSPRAEPWLSCWLGLRQPAAGTDDANRQPTVSRSPSHHPAIALAVGLDCHARGSDEDGRRDNSSSNALESGVAVVRAAPSRDPDIPAGSIRSDVPRRDFAKEI
jgi:hypothetical protein